MSYPPSAYPQHVRVPAHFWPVGLLLLLWNCWGLLGAIAAQVHLFPDLPQEAVAHIDRQPLWLMVFGDLSPLAGAAGSLALLVQSRFAPRLFVAQLAILAVGNLYEVIIGTSPLLTVAESRVSTAFLVTVLTLQTYYAFRMAKRGLLS